MVAAEFQDIEKADQVRLQIGIRVVDAVAHPGLGRQVDDVLHGMAFEDGIELGIVGQVSPVESEVFASKQSQPLLFQAYLIVVIEIVHCDDRTAECEQFSCKMKADETGSTGDKIDL